MLPQTGPSERELSTSPHEQKILERGLFSLPRKFRKQTSVLQELVELNSHELCTTYTIQSLITCN
jgi:hypothetical protein